MNAQNFIRKGRAVFPITPHAKTPAVKDWQSQATADPITFAKWNAQFPDCNYGFIPSSANMIVVDIDAHTADKDGQASLSAWENIHGKRLPETYTVKTPNGGLHLYYYVPADFPFTKKTNFLPGVDLIRSNGYVVVPGSTVDGKRYTDNDKDPEALPDWALKAILERAKHEEKQDQPQGSGAAAGNPDFAMFLDELSNMDTIEEGNRDNRLFALCADWKERGAAEQLMRSLLRITDALGKIAAGSEPKTEEDFRRIARSAWTRKETAFGSQTLDKLFGDTPIQKGKEINLKVSYSAKDLMKMEIPPTRYLVDDLIPEGLSILAGQAKAGKSFLTLDLAASIASGEPFLGRNATKRKVLYCNLESNPGQTKARLQMVKGEFYDFPEDLHIIHDLPPLAVGGLKVIRKAVEKLKPELVIFDTWQKIRSDAGPKNATAYAKEYLELSDLRNALYVDLGVSVLLIHHLKQVAKGAMTDPVQLLNGSSAVGGAVDTILVLHRERGAEEATLSAHGRDIQDLSVPLVKTEPMGWRAIDPGEEDGASSVELRAHTGLQEDIIRVLEGAPDGISARELVIRMGGNAKYKVVWQQLNRWYNEGKLDKVGKAFKMFGAVATDEMDDCPF